MGRRNQETSFKFVLIRKREAKYWTSSSENGEKGWIWGILLKVELKGLDDGLHLRSVRKKRTKND